MYKSLVLLGALSFFGAALSGCDSSSERLSNRNGAAPSASDGQPRDDNTVQHEQSGGHDVGNGGDAVVCQHAYPELGGKTLALLDYYEARHRWALKPELGDATLTVDAKVDRVIARIAELDPIRAQLYSKWHQTFWSEAEVLANGGLPAIADAGPVDIPGPDCAVEQLAVRRAPQVPGDKLYSIDGPLWRQLDTDDQAGLILHELIYREASSLGEPTSDRSRYYNAHVSDAGLGAWTFPQYFDMLRTIVYFPVDVVRDGVHLVNLGNLVTSEQGDTTYTLNSDEIYIGPSVYAASSITFVHDGSLIVPYQASAPATVLPLDPTNSTSVTGGGLTLHLTKDRRLDHISQAPGSFKGLDVEVVVNHTPLGKGNCPAAEINTSPAGVPDCELHGDPEAPSAMLELSANGPLAVTYKTLTFYPDGHLQTVAAFDLNNAEPELPVRGGGTYKPKDGDLLHFSMDGYLEATPH